MRKLSSTGDFQFGNSGLDFFINSPDGVGQTVRTRLLLWLGEFYLDIDDGTPYLQGVLGKYSKAIADTTIQDRVLSTDNVTGIENYVSTLDPETRMMSVTFDIDTSFGTTSVEVSNFTQF